MLGKCHHFVTFKDDEMKDTFLVGCTVRLNLLCNPKDRGSLADVWAPDIRDVELLKTGDGQTQKLPPRLVNVPETPTMLLLHPELPGRKRSKSRVAGQAASCMVFIGVEKVEVRAHTKASPAIATACGHFSLYYLCEGVGRTMSLQTFCRELPEKAQPSALRGAAAAAGSLPAPPPPPLRGSEGPRGKGGRLPPPAPVARAPSGEAGPPPPPPPPSPPLAAAAAAAAKFRAWPRLPGSCAGERRRGWGGDGVQAQRRRAARLPAPQASPRRRPPGDDDDDDDDAGAGAASASPPPEAAGCEPGALPEQHFCPLPCGSERPRGGCPKDPPAGGEKGDGRGALLPTEGSPSQLLELGGGGGGGGREEEEEEKQREPREPDCEEPPENPGDCCREPPPPPSPEINQLPPSILLKIFANLSLNERCLSASLVCKYWRDLCLDFQFWKQLDLSSRQQVTDELLERIASRSQNITEINISDCRNVSDTGVCILASKCPGLLRYTAYRCKQLSDTSIIAVASQCPQLQKVHVGNQDRLTDEGLKQLGSECRELKDIHFGQCYKISDEGMIIIAKGCLKLQRIYMQENKLVTDQSVKAFAEHCPELQYVGFMGCSVTSKGVIHLTNLRHLSSLDLRHITELDNETVMEIVKRCKNLTSLNLCLNWIINDR
ncbi:hypothetical protein JRQ81_013658 [Phrynocephalus forsythii]|uniref:F-box domain-containing protein n=1 Tax=Phrynocephalus forsythii TaxID=171643 RepID=A0A9Q1B4H5_9SAUR|nr:hypothetical protein JRQ81_013658 [Phrynocephalus forsythii]